MSGNRLRKVLRWWLMPFGWIRRGCFDWQAARVAYWHGWRTLIGRETR